MIRKLKPELLLAENIRTLLYRRNLDAVALAVWCGHGESWISKIINGKRGAQLKDVGKMADFFGLTVAEMFQHGISEVAERREKDRRSSTDRRTGQDRRQLEVGRLHPDVQPRFPPRRFFDEEGHTKPMRLRAAHGSAVK